MYTEFHIKANELDDAFIKTVRSLFKSKRISIIIEEENDETEYLLKSESNRRTLLASKRQDEKGERITVNISRRKK